MFIEAQNRHAWLALVKCICSTTKYGASLTSSLSVLVADKAQGIGRRFEELLIA
jgi:hypothetical protein